MRKHVLFIQGAGEGAHAEDERLVTSLSSVLNRDYKVIYPIMPHEADPHYGAWKQSIEAEMAKLEKPIMLVGHSVGASMLIKYLSETKVEKPVAGIFLMAAPFWGGDGWHYEGYEELELPSDLSSRLPKGVPIFLYQSRDDDIVPYEHLALYKKLLPHAKVREQDNGGHQFDEDLTVVAHDIRSLE